jgi:hypothetical protein
MARYDQPHASTWWTLDHKALENAMALDRAFFEANPNVASYERAFVPGESHFQRPPCGYEVRVKVIQLEPGIRTREIYTRRKGHGKTAA